MKEKFFRLNNSITSTIYEGIVKIGYEKDTSINIYYDLDLLNYLLNTDFLQENECLSYLQEYLGVLNTEHPFMQIQLVKKRFQFTVTKYGVEKILSEYQDKPFLKDLIEMAKDHNFALEDIKALFQKYSSEYLMEETDNMEFQYVFSFPDKKFDEYMYCFNLNDCYYHRLLPYDYEHLSH